MNPEDAVEELPEGWKLADGHVYKVHFEAGIERPSDEELSAALKRIGAVRVQHAAPGGTNVPTPRNN